jgi:hypothetical protein
MASTAEEGKTGDAAGVLDCGSDKALRFVSK